MCSSHFRYHDRLREGPGDISRTLLPAEIAQVRVHGSVDGVDRLWQCGYGSWVAPVTMSHIKNEIDRKQQNGAPRSKKVRPALAGDCAGYCYGGARV